jgi:ParB family transcriptional regulator, chromosome partitioning protein
LAPKKKGFDASYLAGITQNASKSTVLIEQASEAQQQVEADIQQAVVEGNIIWFDIALLDDNPNQPPGRVVIDDDLRTLSNDIGTNGFMTEYAIPTRISPLDPARRQMVSGHRRKAAAHLAGLTQVPIIVKAYTDLQMLLLNLKENLFRVQLSPLDEAFSYKAMLQVEDPSTGKRLYTQEKIAAEIGKSRGYVRNRLDLLNMAEDIQAMLRQNPNTVRAAYYLQDIEDTALRAEVIAAILREEVTGEQVPGYVQAWRERQMQEPEKHQEQQEEPQDASSAEVERHNEPGDASNVLLQPSSQVALSEASSQIELSSHNQLHQQEGLPPQPDGAPQPPMPRTAQTLMERGDQRSKELLAIGQLKAIRKKFDEYSAQRGSRIPSSEEQALLQEIAHRLDVLHVQE